MILRVLAWACSTGCRRRSQDTHGGSPELSLDCFNPALSLGCKWCSYNSLYLFRSRLVKRHGKAALKSRRCDTEAEGNLPECRVRRAPLTKEGWCLVQHSEHCAHQELSLVLADLFHLQNKAVHWETQCSVLMLGLWSALKCWERVHAVPCVAAMRCCGARTRLISSACFFLQEATALRRVGGFDALGGIKREWNQSFWH